MKKFLSTLIIICFAQLAFGQTVYYWVGGLAAGTGINTGANWNTALNGSGTTRPSSSGASDILIFDGTNLGGGTPATGPAVIQATAGVTCAQMKFVNGAIIQMRRSSTGTSTIIITGDVGEDFVIESGVQVTFNSTVGSMRFTFNAGVDSARVSGTLAVITTQQFRFENSTSGLSHMFRFTSGSSFTSNITSSTSSYAFGNSSQSAVQWVDFENGSNLYYEGGYSPNGSNSTYEPIYFAPTSTWHHRAANGAGSFFNKKNFGNIIVENNSTLTFDGPTYRINNFTINSGCTAIANVSGVTAIIGNLSVLGSFTADVTSTNTVNFAGAGAQTVSGAGTLLFANVNVSESSILSLARNIPVTGDARIFGTINFGTFSLTNPLTFSAQGPALVAQTGSGNYATGDYAITSLVGTFTGITGQTITGPGIPANTVVVNISTTDNAIYLSKPVTANGAGITFSISNAGATLRTSNANGFNSTTGSIQNAGTASFESNINYIIDATTSFPFGLSTTYTGGNLNINTITANAAFTGNAPVKLLTNLTLNGKYILRPGDTLHLLTGATIAGTFSASNYIATDFVQSSGVQSFVQWDGLSTATLFPIGTVTYFLPVTLTPTTASSLLAAVFTGITYNGMVNGTQLLGSQKQLVVDAVWNLSQLSGTGNVTVMLMWAPGLEGSTFATLPNSDIGLIKNTGSTYAPPIGTGNNAANTVTGVTTLPGAFSAGAIPQQDPFLFNAIPVKIYGAADFNPGATSLNTTQPIMYTSSNTAVATIVGNNIHIIGAGTSTITATQASDGFYPAASGSQTLTVNKAPLTITADNKTRFEQLPNPALTITYTGFVLGENSSVLTTPANISTTATQTSAPGSYPITVNGATAQNYNISFVNGTLTILAKQNQTLTFGALTVKTYGNPNFTLGGTSTNNTTPVTYTSSNPAVATISGNTVQITGAGTTIITANQAGSAGYFAATPISQTLVVNKKGLTITVRDTTRAEGTPNPVFTILYSGFVLGDNVSNLTTPATITTSAVTSSLPGVYNLILSGATSQNYDITYVNGKLTVTPSAGTNIAYINAYGTGTGSINITIFSPVIALGDVMVYNTLGQPLARKNILVNKGFTTTTLNTINLPSGIYTIRAIGNGVNLQTMISIVK